MENHRHSVVGARQFRIVDPFRIERDQVTHLKPSFVSNGIRTSKYTWLNFFPLCLMQEFRRSANFYFLIIAILQSIPVISPLTPFTAIAPLVIVISISLIREAFEDQKKRASDAQINRQSVVVVRNFEEQCVPWEAIEVGDILRISERGIIPADSIILSSSEDDGTCFIDTSNLDGEANLKFREALRATLGFEFAPSDREKTKYFVKCEQPDQDLYRFSGNISIDAKMFSLSEKQFLLRGATLMNTKWVTLLVVYTGHDTKIMKNVRDAHHKLSHVELLTNKAVVVVFILEVALCAVAAVVHHFWFPPARRSAMAYLLENDPVLMEPVLLFLSFVVLMNTLIPISLVVTVEIIKGVHAKFIAWDDGMRSESGDGAIANTHLNTGNGVREKPEDARVLVGESASDVRSVACFRNELHNPESKESRFALAMATCHTVVCENDLASGDVAYNSDSPDECALVRGATAMGVKLLGRTGQHLVLSLTEEGRERSYLKTVTYTLSYEVLRTMVMMDHVTQFAVEGYRVLLFAERVLDEGFYEAWERRYQEAELDMLAREERMESLVEELERKLTLVGASAVEDKLQEGVPDTVSLFQKAGIKIWVLTGDKLETSVEMGKLCRVVTPGMREVILRAATREEMSQRIDTALRESRCINYFFYKNIVFTLPQFIYGAVSAYSGQSALLSTYHAVVVTGVPMLLFYTGGGGMSPDGVTGDLWAGSVASFFYIVPLVHFQIYLDTWNWTSLVCVVYCASLVAFVAAVAVYDHFASSVEGAWSVAVLTPTFWLGFWLSTVACLMPHMAIKCYQENFTTTNPVHILRRARCFNKIVDSSQLGAASGTSKAVARRPAESVK
ncbi:hypothetical protein PybrP1_002072 [[Pythium] brassicae (nom. inval.)]|nr:hypothetical protein PybrP1_002072 [[Pythium] brassicae (nom. inval.)]